MDSIDTNSTSEKVIQPLTIKNSVQSKVQLKKGSLNVSGLKRRLFYVEFTAIVKYYDIFGVLETKWTTLTLFL